MFYKIHSKKVFMDSIHLNINGKVDIKEIKMKESNKAAVKNEGEFPVKKLEKTLLELFSNTLDQTEIGVNDSFFECGGDRSEERRVGKECRARGGAYR